MIDDVTTIELRAIAGQTIPLVDPSYTPDDAASGIKDGTTNDNPRLQQLLPVPGHAERRLPDQAGDVVAVTAGHVDLENPFAGQGAVMLDIGGDVGALVVEMPREMLGVEIEIRPADLPVASEHGHAHHPHVAVVDRRTPAGPVPSLVFGEVRAGTYHLCDKGGTEVLATATVRGSEVTQLTWPG